MSRPLPARALGIDFGTSNSSVGWQGPQASRLLPLEGDKCSLPSVIFFNNEERRPAYGRQALDEYLDGYEGRLLRSLKSLLGSKLLASETTLLGSAMPFRQVLGLFLGELKRRAEQAAGRSFTEVVLGRPVFFVDNDPQADREAADTLQDVARQLGFREVSFQYEPIAAAFDYECQISREELVLIVDIGGGTSDFSLLRLSPARRQDSCRDSDILASDGLHIGGTDFDKQLSLAGVMPLFGYGSRMHSAALMPTHYHLNLATWHTINALYTQKTRLALQSLRYDCQQPQGIDRLLRLLERREGHWLALQVEARKIDLGHSAQQVIALGQIEEGLQAELSRALFEQAIEAPLQRIANTVQGLLASAGVRAEQVDTLLFTGGSSAVPALRARVAALLPGARQVEGDRFGGIGSGLAIEAARRYGCSAA
ncbi:Hsp70 family protein [Pseudomonas fluvialis]|uniref:Heat-shock protein n=1 Tax=Pseudomonas fluvialis TaxID=1793966 RepID=A0ABQ2ATW8_9PSED|nr:Hsp70 family protein [Pseudomonas fluvialis]GGH95810.1 heat-shock protein [Pseudomonas fluvialis]